MSKLTKMQKDLIRLMKKCGVALESVYAVMLMMDKNQNKEQQMIDFINENDLVNHPDIAQGCILNYAMEITDLNICP